MSDQQDIFNIRRQMSSADHEVVTVSRNIVTFSCFLVAEEDITDFPQFIGEKFPDMTVTPKLHMLEEHVCPFLRQWHMGLGFYGEQGIEGIHSEFNTQSQHFDHVKKKDTRLRQILVNHHIATSPELAGKAPKPKERNLKRKANE